MLFTTSGLGKDMNKNDTHDSITFKKKILEENHCTEKQETYIFITEQSCKI